MVARTGGGVRLEGTPEGTSDPAGGSAIQAVFFLLSPEADPGLHLRILAHIARTVDHPDFMTEWLRADSDQQLKELLYRDERMFVMTLDRDLPGSDLIGLALRELSLPDGTLIAMIRRADDLVIPKGDTELLEGDRLTVIGRPAGIITLRKRYGGSPS